MAIKTVLKGYSVRKLVSNRKRGAFLSEGNSSVCYQGTTSGSPASVSFLCAVIWPPAPNQSFPVPASSKCFPQNSCLPCDISMHVK